MVGEVSLPGRDWGGGGGLGGGEGRRGRAGVREENTDAGVETPAGLRLAGLVVVVDARDVGQPPDHSPGLGLPPAAGWAGAGSLLQLRHRGQARHRGHWSRGGQSFSKYFALDLKAGRLKGKICRTQEMKNKPPIDQ